MSPCLSACTDSPTGGSPPWIVQGTYMADQASELLQGVPYMADQELLQGVLRSNLANEEFIEWLPETMAQFAEQTGPIYIKHTD